MSSQISNKNYMYGNKDECDCSHIEIPDVSCMADRKHTRNETCDTSNDSLEAEIIDLNVQLANLQETIEDIEKSHKQCYSNLCRDYDGLSMEYKQMSNNIVEIQKDNNNLQSGKHCKIQKQFQMVKEIEELNIFINKNVECNEILQNKNDKEKECFESLERQQCDLEKAICCKTAEVDRLRCKSTDVENTICCENVKLQEMQRRNGEYGQTVKELTSACRELDARLSALRETGPVKLAEADQSADAAHTELADVCAVAADWKARCERAEDEHRELRADVCEETSRAQAALNELGGERDRLTAQLSETSARLAAARCDSQQLSARVKTKTDQLDVLRAEKDRLKRRAYQTRSAQAVHQAKIDVENRQIEDQRTVNGQRLLAVENEIEALKQASSQREEVIKNARNELNDCCATNRPVQRFSM